MQSSDRDPLGNDTPLYERGVRVLSGYFRSNSQGEWDINYRWDDAHSEYLFKHDAWKDFESGIVLAKIDIVCSTTPTEQIVPLLEPLTKVPSTAEIMDPFTHEQYFWPFYHNHIPDHAQRLDTTIRFCTEKGHKPVLYHEGCLGASGQREGRIAGKSTGGSTSAFNTHRAETCVPP